jgi:hypothetical protein
MMKSKKTAGRSGVKLYPAACFGHLRQRVLSAAQGSCRERRTRETVLLSFFFFAVAVCCHAQHIRTQSFDLSSGWNAIYLAVEPLQNSPADLFAEEPLDIVAVFDEARSTGQFAADPSVDMLRQLGWGVWYAPERDDSFLTDLAAINANKGYLVHAAEAFTLEISGTVEMPDVWWKAGAFNLTGYTLDESSPPTFEQFFSGSAVLAGQEVYRLENAVWKRVTNLSATPMKSGEAFWIYRAGPCSYPGPLDVTTGSPGGIVTENRAVDLTLKNRTALPIQPTVEHVADGPDAVPIAIVIDAVNSEAGELSRVAVPMEAGSWSQLLPPLEGERSIRIPIQVRTSEVTEPEVETLLCIKTDLGTEHWVPVTGLREDLK